MTRFLDGRIALLVLLTLAVTLLPLGSASIPPLLDYHNHLARQYIVAGIDGSDVLAQFYKTSWHASPYLAFDGIVQGLAHFMPIAVAGKVFLGLMLLLLALASMALNLVLFGRVTPVALLGLLFVHNETVTLGFVNYLFGVGFGLCGAALWIQVRHRALWLRLGLALLVCSLIFFSHLLGFVIYTLVICSYEFGQYLAGIRRGNGRRNFGLDRDQRWNLLAIALQCVVPLAIFAAFGPSAEIVSTNTYGGINRKVDLLLGAFGYLMPIYLWSVDRWLQLALPAALLLLLVTRRLRIAPGMGWPLSALLVLFLIMPMQLFSGWGADHRLLPALGLFMVGVLGPGESVSARAQKWAFAVITLLVVVRVAAVTADWRKTHDEYAEYTRAFEVVDKGSKLFFAFGHSGGKNIGNRPVYHLPTLVLSRREVYVPFLFATSSGGFTLQYRSEVEPWQRLSNGPVLLQGASPDWAAIRDHFDYILLVNQHHFRDPPPADLVQVFAGRTVRVYRRADVALRP